MRRDVVTQIIVEYPSGCENFATRLEAERFINANLPPPGAALARPSIRGFSVL